MIYTVNIASSLRSIPKIMLFGFVIKENGKVLHEKSVDTMQEGGLQEACYLGLINAIKFSLKKGYEECDFMIDAKSVCKQVNHKRAVKDKKMLPYWKEVISLKVHFKSIKIGFVPRDKNRDAMVLARRNIVTDVYCPYCNNKAVWCENSVIYGRNYGDSYMCYYCKPCDAYVGCHNNTDEPLGTMANKELREARKEAHRYIDWFWKSNKMRRWQVYRKLNNHFGEEVHIGWSDIKRCKEILKVRF